MDNSILTLHITKPNNLWVFDDEAVGLKNEPFVCGMNEIIDIIVSEFENPEKGIDLIFSAKEFPNHAGKLDWQKEDCGGNWYVWGKNTMSGWLCPALYKYFKEAPKEIYFKAIKK